MTVSAISATLSRLIRRVHVSQAVAALVLALAVAVVADVQASFNFLSRTLVVVCGVVALVSLVAVVRKRQWVLATLLVGTTLTLWFRYSDHERAQDRTVETWDAYQRQRRFQTAERVTAGFLSLSERVQQVAKRLAQNDILIRTTTHSNDSVSREQAFDLLSATQIPKAIAEGLPGATVYDQRGRPLAWAGDNVSAELMDEALSGGRRLFTIRRGVHVYFVALEPLTSHTGFLTLEIPLLAERRLDNQYLQDYDAVTGWAGRSVETDFIFFDQESDEVEQMFQARGEPFWGGTDEVPRLYFGLRANDNTLHGVVSVAVEAVATSQLEAERRSRTRASISMSITVFAALLLFLISDFRAPPYGLRLALKALVALWGARLVLLWIAVPLGLGAQLDNPAHFATSLGWDLYRSPIDFLLTNAALLLSVLILFAWWRSRPPPELREDEVSTKAPFYRAIASGTTLLLILGALHVVRDAWANSNLDISGVSFVPWSAPQFTMQLGLAFLFLSVLTASIWIYTAVAAEVSPETDWRTLAWDVTLLAGAFWIFGSTSWRELVFYAPLPLFAAQASAIFVVRVDTSSSVNIYTRIALVCLLLTAAILPYYPALNMFEDKVIRHFVENTVAPAVINHDESQEYVLNETTKLIDRMERQGRLDGLTQADLAYEIWAASDLAVSAFSSSIEILDASQSTVSRFALNFQRDDRVASAELDQAEEQWTFETDPVYGVPDHPGILIARRAVPHNDETWEYRVQLAADWRNLPFIFTSDPYLRLFRTSGTDHTLPFPPRELHLAVHDQELRMLNQPAEASLRLDSEDRARVQESAFWTSKDLLSGAHRTFVFTDSEYLYALSYAQKGWLAWAAELASWLVFVPVLLVSSFFLRLVLGRGGLPVQLPLSELRSGATQSFYGRLYVAFVLLALVPIVSLAFLVRSVLVRQLERDIEQEGRSRAETVQRVVSDYLLDRVDLENLRFDDVTDPFIEWIASLVAADVDIFNQGELAATSKRELYASGFLSMRAVPSSYRRVAVDKQPYSIHWESVGPFRYMVVSLPLSLESTEEPAILSLPLASRQRETDRKFAFLNQSVLLAALAFALAGLALAQALARRIAEPVNSLTRATHRVADGEFDVVLGEPPNDEIGALFESFLRMTEELKQQRDDLERSKKLEAWAEMARQVAHEVKNPLTPIQLSAEHLLRVYKDTSVDFDAVLEECTDTILTQVRALRQISMEFSTFASPTELDMESTDIGSLVAEVIRPYELSPPQGVHVSLRLDALPRLSVDRRLTKRTVINLMENALHAVSHGGSVAVEVVSERVDAPNRDRTDWVRISVVDDGVGLDEELKARVFEPYFSTRAAGSGLGLAIAKKVIEDHGGRIELESELGRGTTVSLWLPRIKPTKVPDAAAPQSEETNPSMDHSAEALHTAANTKP